MEIRVAPPSPIPGASGGLDVAVTVTIPVPVPVVTADEIIDGKNVGLNEGATPGNRVPITVARIVGFDVGTPVPVLTPFPVEICVAGLVMV